MFHKKNSSMKRIILFYLFFNLIVVVGILFFLEPPKMELAFGAAWFCLIYTTFGSIVIRIMNMFKFRSDANKLVTLILLLLIMDVVSFIFDGTFVTLEFLKEAHTPGWNEGTSIKLFFHLDLVLSYLLANIDFKWGLSRRSARKQSSWPPRSLL